MAPIGVIPPCRTTLRGHYAYYGLTDNNKRIRWFLKRVILTWKRWLARRGQKEWFTWEQMEAILARYPLPPARIVHKLQAP